MHIAISAPSNYAKDFVNKQVSSNLKHLTLDLRKAEDLTSILSELKDLVMQNKVKVTVFGKWYDSSNVEQVKDLIESTKDFDGLMLNLVLNYDGQEEIVDACRIIARLHTQGKISVNEIDADLIKEHIYTSNFPPPDVIYLLGTEKADFMLWESSKSKIKIIKNIEEINF